MDRIDKPFKGCVPQAELDSGEFISSCCFYEDIRDYDGVIPALLVTAENFI